MYDLLLVIIILIPGAINWFVAHQRLLNKIRYITYFDPNFKLYHNLTYWSFSVIEFGLPCIIAWGLDFYLFKSTTLGTKFFVFILSGIAIAALFNYRLRSSQKVEIKSLNIAVLLEPIVEIVYDVHSVSLNWLCHNLVEENQNIGRQFLEGVRAELKQSSRLDEGLTWFADIYVNNDIIDLDEADKERLQEKCNQLQQESVDRKIGTIISWVTTYCQQDFEEVLSMFGVRQSFLDQNRNRKGSPFVSPSSLNGFSTFNRN